MLDCSTIHNLSGALGFYKNPAIIAYIAMEIESISDRNLGFKPGEADIYPLPSLRPAMVDWKLLG